MPARFERRRCARCGPPPIFTSPVLSCSDDHHQTIGFFRRFRRRFGRGCRIRPLGLVRRLLNRNESSSAGKPPVLCACHYMVRALTVLGLENRKIKRGADLVGRRKVSRW